MIGLFGFLGLVSHFILVDYTPEYPWVPRKVLGLEFPSVHLVTYGFPHHRNLPEIGAWFAENYENEQFIVSNEYISVLEFYLPSQFVFSSVKEIDQQLIAGWDGVLILWIEQPQSWIDKIWGIRKETWDIYGQPIHEFQTRDNRNLGSVYSFTQEEILDILASKNPD